MAEDAGGRPRPPSGDSRRPASEEAAGRPSGPDLWSRAESCRNRWLHIAQHWSSSRRHAFPSTSASVNTDAAWSRCRWPPAHGALTHKRGFQQLGRVTLETHCVYTAVF